MKKIKARFDGGDMMSQTMDVLEFIDGHIEQVIE